MTKETYIKMTQPFRDHPNMAKGIHMANKACTLIMYVSYPCLLLYLLMTKNVFFVRVLLVPAISFVLLSVGRKVFNRPRPYEVFDVPSVIKKDTKGKSFPSRHVFSACIIAMTFLLASPWTWIGLVFMVVTIVLAIVRVVSGVHFISDVIAGIAVGVLAALIGFIWI